MNCAQSLNWFKPMSTNSRPRAERPVETEDMLDSDTYSEDRYCIGSDSANAGPCLGPVRSSRANIGAAYLSSFESYLEEACGTDILDVRGGR